MRKSAKSIIALVPPNGLRSDPRAQHRKAHNLKIARNIRMLRAGREQAGRTGASSRSGRSAVVPSHSSAAYEPQPRLSSGGYQSVLRRIDEILDGGSRGPQERSRRARLVLEIDDAVSGTSHAVEKRVDLRNYAHGHSRSPASALIRFSTSAGSTSTMLARMLSASRFNVDRVKQRMYVHGRRRRGGDETAVRTMN